MSERHAYRLVRLSRDSYRHAPVTSAQTVALKTKIVEIAHARRRFGYRRVHDLLRPDLPGVNHKRVYRLLNSSHQQTTRSSNLQLGLLPKHRYGGWGQVTSTSKQVRPAGRTKKIPGQSPGELHTP